MIDAVDVRSVDRSGDDWESAERIKAAIHAMKQVRQPFHLTPKDLEPVLRYKLRGQQGRTEKHRRGWSAELVAAVTGAAFSIKLDARETELQARVAVLTALPGVGIPVASAILAMTDPDRYAILDFRVWRQVFGEEKKSFSVGDYLVYMRQVWRLAEELQWQPQIVDWCIWRRDLG